MIKRILIAILLMSLSLYSGSHLVLTENQKKNLKRCIRIAEILELNRPDEICPIMLNETSAEEGSSYVGDRFLPLFKRSYGIMQIRYKTMMYTINKFPRLKKRYGKHAGEILLAKLMFDKTFNIEIANYYFYLLKKKYNGDILKAAIAYNQGTYRNRITKYGKKYIKNRRLFKYILENGYLE